MGRIDFQGLTFTRGLMIRTVDASKIISRLYTSEYAVADSNHCAATSRKMPPKAIASPAVDACTAPQAPKAKPASPEGALFIVAVRVP